MEQEPTDPSAPPRPPESELGATPETALEVPSLEAFISEKLGYVETPEMAAAREAWSTAIETGTREEKMAAAERYQELSNQEQERLISQVRAGRELLDRLIMGSNQVGSEADVTAEPEALGFHETADMRELRARIMLARADESTAGSSELFEQLEAYRQQANRQETLVGERFQLGRMLAGAAVWRDASRPDYANEDIEGAAMYADDVGDIPEIAEGIQALMIPVEPE